VIVPDARLNTILVQGTRADRSKIEDLLRFLDTADVPEGVAANKPKLVPIKNTQAARVEQIIRSLFAAKLKAQGSSGNGSSGWFDPEMTVDEVTNSLIVMAPGPLAEEITKLAETLDEAALADRSRSVRIIPLKKTNVGRMEGALDMLLRSGGGSPSGRSYRSGRGG
jgi:type II secretory pathway component GspD/PulD (secretin)